MDWHEQQLAWSGEQLTRREALKAVQTKRPLLKAFPPGERAFCKVVDKLRARLPQPAKKLLWYNRQKAFQITPEILYFGDFYFKAFKVLVEIDGASHAGELAREQDALRTKLIGTRGIRVLRYTNDEITGLPFQQSEAKLISFLCAGPHRTQRTLSEGYRSAQAQRPDLY